jgi:hypothetical protein
VRTARKVATITTTQPVYIAFPAGLSLPARHRFFHPAPCCHCRKKQKQRQEENPQPPGHAFGSAHRRASLSSPAESTPRRGCNYTRERRKTAFFRGFVQPSGLQNSLENKGVLQSAGSPVRLFSPVLYHLSYLSPGMSDARAILRGRENPGFFRKPWVLRPSIGRQSSASRRPESNEPRAFFRESPALIPRASFGGVAIFIGTARSGSGGGN